MEADDVLRVDQSDMCIRNVWGYHWGNQKP